MVEHPYIWDIGEDIIMDTFVGDPNTGLGLTGQTVKITIEKRSISQFWTGSAYSVTRTELDMTEVESTDEPGRYRFVLPGSPGNVTADTYFVHSFVRNAPTVEGDDYSIHVSRDLEARVYETEPSIRS